MSIASMQFELFQVAPAAAPPPGAAFVTLPVPQEPHFLVVPPNEVALFNEAAAVAPSGSVILQPVLRGPLPGPALVMCSIGAASARVNGQPAPVVAVLRERDCVQLGDAAVFFVALRVSPSVVPASGETFGARPCPVCSTPFKGNQLAYVCPFCDAAMHAGGEGSLDCVNHTAECRGCHREVVRRETLTSFPDFPVHAHAR